jgi:hypothetical protein
MAQSQTQPISYERRKKLAEDLKTLTKDQYEEIYRIIKRAGISYSENSNGVFFDLNRLDDAVAESLIHFMDLVAMQQAEEKRRSDELAYYRTAKEEEEAANAATRASASAGAK